MVITLMFRFFARLRLEGSFSPACKMPCNMSFFMHLYKCIYRESDPISVNEYVIIALYLFKLTFLNIFELGILIWSVAIIIGIA